MPPSPKVLFLVVTNHSVTLDERIRKETKSLGQCGCTCEIVATELSNRAYSGVTEEGVSYRTLSLITRRLLPRGRFLWFKALELHLQLILASVFRRWDCLWVVDHTCAGMVIYGSAIRLLHPHAIIVWDQHELGPERYLGTGWYQWLIARCRWVINANDARSSKVKSLIDRSHHEQILVLENFPADAEGISNSLPLPKDFEAWLSQSRYCLFQGGGFTHRAIFQCVEAVLLNRSLKMLVLGPMPASISGELARRWPSWRERVWVTGWIDPAEFARYIDKAVVSLVFYESIDLNHWLCAPNRLYHALLRGVPIVCGPNPPMKKVVDEYNVGVSCNSIAANPAEIREAIDIALSRESELRAAVKKVKHSFTWESQNHIFRRIASSMKQ